MGGTSCTANTPTRLLGAVLASVLVFGPALATALQSRQPACSLSNHQTFSRQALTARLAGMVVFGKTPNRPPHQPVHNAYKDFIGADVGGDLRRMSRMLRYLEKAGGGLFPKKIHAL